MNKDLLSKELTDLVNKYSSSEEMVEALYKKSKLHNKEQVEKLLEGSQKSLKKIRKRPYLRVGSRSFVAFLNEVRPGYRQMTKMKKVNEKLCKSLMMTYPEKSFWADANSTLRLTYGKVEGSAPRDGMEYTWYTTMDGIIEKYNTGEADFECLNVF